MKTLVSNNELYDYMIRLSSELKSRGSTGLSDAIDFACGQASSLCTEFLGESRIALRRVSTEGKSILTDQERADLSDILKQLDAAFDKR